MNPDKIRISYWGSPAISAFLLEKLILDNRFDISFVVTQPDKPRSKRGREVLPSPVKKIALENNIPVFEPASLKKELKTLCDEFSRYNILFHVVFAYGRLIPADIFNAPILKTINFHASLLPLLRGAAPIEYALLEGHKKTGWSIQAIVEKMDAGDVFFQKEISIYEDDTKKSLAEKMISELLNFGPDVIEKYACKELLSFKQDENKATFCGKIKTEDAKINWDDDHIKIRNLYRAFFENPGVFSFFNFKKIKIDFDLSIPVQNYKINEKAPNGQIISIEKDKFWIVCGDKVSLPVGFIQPEGKKKMKADDFVNGYRIKEGDVIGR
ncbi:MAG: methionyl-tRNA formyltransferase [Spirochaetia bacterium]|nr:methionyl-tRNA formyltransferase [Spirochaetia bacterium]